MTEQELQHLCEQLSLQFFNRPFTHRIHYNRRLRSTGGRYLLKTGTIEINPKVEQILGYEALIGVLKHELCHYHLHQTGRGYRHQDVDFKTLLKAVGGSRYVDRMEPARYVYQCKHCKTLYHRMKKMNTTRYRCGKCHGPLVLIAAENIKN